MKKQISNLKLKNQIRELYYEGRYINEVLADYKGRVAKDRVIEAYASIEEERENNGLTFWQEYDLSVGLGVIFSGGRFKQYWLPFLGALGIYLSDYANRLPSPEKELGLAFVLLLVSLLTSLGMEAFRLKIDRNKKK